MKHHQEIKHRGINRLRWPALLLLGVFLAFSVAGCGLLGQPPGAGSTLFETKPVPGDVRPGGTPAAAEGDCAQPAVEEPLCGPGQTTPEQAVIPTADFAAPLQGPAFSGGLSTDVQATAEATRPSADTETASQTQIAPSPTPCGPELCVYNGQLRLALPIPSPGNGTVDVAYRFGTTQGETRDPHHGVEFLNSFGTPVLAAADGVVVVAGDDREIFYGPYSYFYGNLVVIEHRYPDLSEPLYTLYGHLSQIAVETGEKVQAGEEIGSVGMSGVATGSHLHFEVRLGENTYERSSNPELWLRSRPGEDGELKGALAGKILDAEGKNLPVESIVVEHLTGPEGSVDTRVYVGTYEEKALVGQPLWGENFAAGDLPAGWYRITFVQSGMQERLVQVFPGQLTVVTWQFGDS